MKSVEVELKSSGLKISFLGDISLNDNYIDLYEQGIKPFQEIDPDLVNADYVIGNLECMAKGRDGENLLKRPRLNTTVDTLNYLDNIHLDVACLAQNHVYDHLEDGFKNTTGKLKDLGIKYLGAGYSEEEAFKPLILEKDGISIGLLNFVAKDTNPNLPDDAGVFLNNFQINKVKRQIKGLRGEVDHLILLLHWGGKVENGFYPDWNQPELARELIEIGADLIIGHHPHTLQPYEIYKGKYIFYSIGNFCFSDIFFENKKIRLQSEKQTESLIVEVEFKRKNYKVNLIPVENAGGFIKKNELILNKLEKRLKRFEIIKTNKVFWYLYYFKLKKIDPLLHYLGDNERSFIDKIKQITPGKIIRFLKPVR